MKPNKTLFVDIDTQFDFMDPKGALYVPKADTLVPKIKALLKYALDNEIPVLASADAHPIDDPEFEQFPPHCVENTKGQKKISETQIASTLVLPNHIIDFDLSSYKAVLVEKTIFDLFGNPNAVSILEYIQPKDCFVFGVATDYCVKAAALGLKTRGYNVYLVEDAIQAVTAEGKIEAYAEMEAQGIVITQTEKILEGAKK